MTVEVTTNKLHGRAVTGTIVAHKHQWAQSPISTTAVADRIRIDIIGPTCFDVLVVQCTTRNACLRNLDKPVTRVTMSDNCNAETSHQRLRNMNNGVVTVDEIAILTPATLRWPSGGITLDHGDSSATGMNSITVRRSSPQLSTSSQRTIGDEDKIATESFNCFSCRDITDHHREGPLSVGGRLDLLILQALPLTIFTRRRPSPKSRCLVPIADEEHALPPLPVASERL